MESLFYCPVSARFSSSSFELFTPSDTPIRRYEGSDKGAREALEALQLRVGAELAGASDAAFVAYSWQDAKNVLVSRAPFGADDLERITDELLLAAARPELTGVLSSKVAPNGHLVVCIDYVPVEGRPASPEHAEALVDGLGLLRSAGIVHGGINERFVNPEAPVERRVFGVGLSEAYAAWRRSQGLAIGELRADPRFATAAELRGEAPTLDSDAFALAAVVLCATQTPGEPIPPLDPVQGINALLAKASQRAVLVQFASSVADKRLRRTLESMLAPAREPDYRMWRMAIFVGLGVIVLMLLWLITRPDPTVHVAATNSSPVVDGRGSLQCGGPGVVEADGRCELASGYGRCASGTRYEAETSACVVDAQEDEAAEEVQELAGAEALPAGPHIHPVLECGDDQRMIHSRYSFSNSDIAFTQAERHSFARLAAQCKGPASVVYYTSNPTLEARANTIFDELRSSSICGQSCRESLPADPTAVVYVPYIGLIERSNAHYLFLHCCI